MVDTKKAKNRTHLKGDEARHHDLQRLYELVDIPGEIDWESGERKTSRRMTETIRLEKALRLRE